MARTSARSDVDRIGNTIMEASARARYVTALADRAEELGEGVPPGEDWMDHAPETSDEARKWAEELWTDIVAHNPMGLPAGTPLLDAIEEIWNEVAAKSDIDPSTNGDQERFGHDIAMEAMGTGVAWSDNHKDHDLDVPYHDHDDPYTFVPDADLAVFFTPEQLIDTVLEALPEGIEDEAFDVEGQPTDDQLTLHLVDIYGATQGDNSPEELTALSQLRDNVEYRRAYDNEERWERSSNIASILYDALNRRVQETRECPTCGGTGRVDLPEGSRHTARCPSCNGSGRTRIRRRNPAPKKQPKKAKRKARKNPIIEYRDVDTHKVTSTDEKNKTDGYQLLSAHVRNAITHEEMVLIEALFSNEGERGAAISCALSVTVYFAPKPDETEIAPDATVEEKVAFAKEYAYFVWREQESLVVAADTVRCETQGCRVPAPCSTHGTKRHERAAVQALRNFFSRPDTSVMDPRWVVSIDHKPMLVREWLGGRKIRTAYTITTDESAEHGDFAEQGWVNEEGESMEPDEWDIEEGVEKYTFPETAHLPPDSLGAIYNAVRFLRSAGVMEASSSSFQEGIWYIGEEDFNNETGEREQHSYFLANFDPDERRTVYNALFGPRGRRRNPSTTQKNPIEDAGERCRECGVEFVKHALIGRVRNANRDEHDLTLCEVCGSKMRGLARDLPDFEETVRRTKERELKDFENLLKDRRRR